MKYEGYLCQDRFRDTSNFKREKEKELAYSRRSVRTYRLFTVGTIILIICKLYDNRFYFYFFEYSVAREPNTFLSIDFFLYSLILLHTCTVPVFHSTHHSVRIKNWESDSAVYSTSYPQFLDIFYFYETRRCHPHCKVRLRGVNISAKLIFHVFLGAQMGLIEAKKCHLKIS